MIGEPLIILPSTDSTNNHAMREYREGRGQVGTAYFAIAQTQGKGQREKSWYSKEGENIILSLILQPQNVPIHHTFILTCTVALACADFFSKWAGEETKIKWPNDIFWRDRKAGGILIESAVSGNKLQAAIVGIGINVNQTQFPELSNKAVSLKQITGKSYNPIELAKELCSCIQMRMNQANSGEFEFILDAYNKLLFGKTEEHQFKIKDGLVKAKVVGVNSTGELILLHGNEHFYRMGEVEWIL